MFWKLTLAIVLIAGIGGAFYLSGVTRAQVKEAVLFIEKSALVHEPHPLPAVIPVHLKEETPWDGLVTLTPDEQKAIGIQLATVEAQTKPLRLDLTGKTAYDPDTLTKIRPRFDTLVEKVYAMRGQKVRINDPLLELHSTDLAAAKSDYQSKYVQWLHDMKLYTVRKELVQTGAISKQQWVETQNDEKKSKLEYTLAEDKLKLLKVPKADIDRLLTPLSDSTPAKQNFGPLDDKAKMTLRSPVEGIVIEREVVPQNFYDTSSVLMVIAPLDHLWVLVNVYELDQDKVKVGQTMEIEFPFLQETVRGTVQFVANEVSKDTHAVNVRASIPNPKARLKADMLVKAKLDIPPEPGQTVIPRQAMVTSNGIEYVFVRKTTPEDGKNPGTKSPIKFDRRRIFVAQENHENVVVARGLHPHEEVATSGSLILSELYEDATTVSSGVPTE